MNQIQGHASPDCAGKGRENTEKQNTPSIPQLHKKGKNKQKSCIHIPRAWDKGSRLGDRDNFLEHKKRLH